MKHTLSLLATLFLATLSYNLHAQTTDLLDKAYEVLTQEGDEPRALRIIEEQLQETPDYVEALLMHVKLLRNRGEYSLALQDINRALKVNNPKESGFAQSTLYWWKGHIYQDVLDIDNAAAAFLEAYALAEEDDPENLIDIGFDFAQMLYFQKKYDEADVIYWRILDSDETYLPAMIGLARNKIAKGLYQEAIGILEKCRRYDTEYYEVYRFMMQAYDKLGDTIKAIDSALEWFDKTDDANKEAILEVLKKRPNYAEACLLTRSGKSDYPYTWMILLCQFYEETHKYAEAVKIYNELEAKFGSRDIINIYRSECYNELGLFNKAIEDITIAIKHEADWYTLVRRADYYRLSGDLDSAVNDLSAAIVDSPKEGYAYYLRGWCYEMKGDRERAMENYNLGLDMTENYPYLYLMRGELYLADGETALALADFEAIVQKDTIPEKGSCRQYALHFLGRDDEALEWMEKIIAADPDENGCYYDLACLYARMGLLDDAVKALRTAFEKGYRKFSHIRLDDDMDPIRNLPEFKSLVRKYEAKHEEYLRKFDLELPQRYYPVA